MAVVREKVEVDKPTLIERMGFSISGSVEKWFPDPFLFAVILLFIVYILAWVFQGSTIYDSMGYMYQGFWSFLAFAMQMCLIVVLGYSIATHPAVVRLITNLCRIPNNGKQAAALVALIATVFSWVNWGLGLIMGGMMAREMAKNAHKRGMPIHYPVLCAAGYTGLGLSWHYGLSGSAPLLSNVSGHFLEGLIGLVPANETIFSSYALLNTLVIVIFAMLMCAWLHPRQAARCRGLEHYAPALLEEKKTDKSAEEAKTITVADKIDNSLIIALIVVILAVGAMVWWFKTQGFMGGLNLDSVNFMFIIIGLVLYRSPMAYARSIYRAAGSVGGVILQFPFYAGIQGVMTYSGLAVTFANALARWATRLTMPAIALLMSGLVNLFIPSGGGEWMTIGEIVMRTSEAVGAPAGQTIIAYSAGDAWTNLFNPFWAIALLGVTQVRARDMFGYCIAIMIIATIPYILGLTFIPY